MGISSEKILDFLRTNAFQPHRVFSTRMGQYIETFAHANAAPLLIYVSYDLQASFRDTIELSNAPSIDPEPDLDDPVSLSQIYDTVSQERPLRGAQQLQALYERPVPLDSPERRMENEQRTVQRQTHRLRYAVAGLAHRIAYMSEFHLAIVDPSFDVRMYRNKSPLLARPLQNTMSIHPSRLYVVVDLAFVHQNVRTLPSDIHDILMGIHRVFRQTHAAHTECLQQANTSLSQISTIGPKLLERKESYLSLVDKYRDLLTQWMQRRQQIESEYALQRNVGTTTRTHTASMQHAHRCEKLQDEIVHVNESITRVFRETQKLRSKLDTIALDVDAILVENVLMLQRVQANLTRLDTLDDLYRNAEL